MMGGANPRAVSNAVNDQDAASGNSDDLSDLLWAFGQFLDHDVDFTEFGVAFGSENIAIPEDDDLFLGNSCTSIHFDRSECIGGMTEPREQTNSITAFIDGSNVYGSDEDTANSLRSFTDGLMATTQDGQMLPLSSNGSICPS